MLGEKSSLPFGFSDYSFILREFSFIKDDGKLSYLITKYSLISSRPLLGKVILRFKEMLKRF